MSRQRNLEAKKLFVGPTQWKAMEAADLIGLPDDFDVMGMGEMLAGRGFDLILVMLPANFATSAHRDAMNEWVQYLQCRLFVGGSLRILN